MLCDLLYLHSIYISRVPSDFPVLACCLEDFIEDVAEWMRDSKLKMNDDKTALTAIGTRSMISQAIPNLGCRGLWIEIAPLLFGSCTLPGRLDGQLWFLSVS